MAAQQAPVPPVPPIPGHEVAVTGSLEGWDAVMLLLGAGVILVIVLWPLIRAIARRIEAGAVTSEARTELEGLRERVRALEKAQPRLAELEERVDFAERLLAQQREPDRLQR
jgi:hypothetical protein